MAMIKPAHLNARQPSDVIRVEGDVLQMECNYDRSAIIGCQIIGSNSFFISNFLRFLHISTSPVAEFKRYGSPHD